MSEPDQPINGFFRQLQRTADQKMDTASLRVATFFESSLSGTETHKALVNELIMSVPGETKIDTNGEWLYGCLTPQHDLEIQCTPSCLRGFKLPDYQECTYQVWERSGKGEFHQLTGGSGANSKIAYVYGVPSASALEALEIKALRDHGVETVIIFVPDADTIRYVKKETFAVPPPEEVVVREVVSGAGCNKKPVATPPKQENIFDNKLWIVVVGIVVLVIVCLALYFVFRGRSGETRPDPNSDLLTESKSENKFYPW